MPRYRVSVEIEADDAGLAATTVTGPMREEDVVAYGLWVTEVKDKY